jgi:uncharacterized protein (DUF1810 family)
MAGANRTDDASDPHDLRRFLLAQDDVCATALAELRSGRKRSHWMWFVFPQFAGLGSSATSRHFAIRAPTSAAPCPLRGPRSSSADAGGHRRSAHEIFGSPDDLKLRSSATLFASVSPPGSVFERLLDTYFGGRRMRRCADRFGARVRLSRAAPPSHPSSSR